MTGDPRKLKVLLIDDEPFVRVIITQILHALGVRDIYEANSVRAGMSETLRIRPDLVFCDVHMPGEEGLVYVAELRNTSIPEIAATAVVMLTSDSGGKTVATARELRVNGYLVKPVSLTAVKRAMERALKLSLPGFS
jgi:DNA-binding NarL/FixJ family response regulator